MRMILVIVGACVALSGCGKAGAAEPDGRNPAHCYAALNFGNYWLRKGGQHADQIAEGEARMLFEMKKSRTMGQSKTDFEADGIALTKAHGNDRDAMNALLLNCLNAEEADRDFHKQFPELLALAHSHPSAE